MTQDARGLGGGVESCLTERRVGVQSGLVVRGWGPLACVLLAALVVVARPVAGASASVSVSVGASATLVWTGGGASPVWSDPSNWSTGRVPVDGDSVEATAVETRNDLVGLHLASLTYVGTEQEGALLSGNTITVDTVRDAWNSAIQAPLRVGASSQPWSLSAYEYFAEIDLDGRDVNLAGPAPTEAVHGIPCRCPGFLAFGKITDAVGTGSVTMPDVPIALSGDQTVSWKGTIRAGSVDVYGRWPLTRVEAYRVSTGTGAEVGPLQLLPHSAEAYAGQTYLSADFRVHGDLTLPLSTAFGSNDSHRPVHVSGNVVVADGVVAVLTGDGAASVCRQGLLILDIGEGTLSGRFAGVIASTGTSDAQGNPVDALIDDDVVVHYHAGDGNDVSVRCTPKKVSTKPAHVPSTVPTTVSTPSPSNSGVLPETGRGTDLLAVFAGILLSFGGVAAWVGRRRTAIATS